METYEAFTARIKEAFGDHHRMIAGLHIGRDASIKSIGPDTDSDKTFMRFEGRIEIYDNLYQKTREPFIADEAHLVRMRKESTQDMAGVIAELMGKEKQNRR